MNKSPIQEQDPKTRLEEIYDWMSRYFSSLLCHYPWSLRFSKDFSSVFAFGRLFMIFPIFLDLWIRLFLFRLRLRMRTVLRSLCLQELRMRWMQKVIFKNDDTKIWLNKIAWFFSTQWSLLFGCDGFRCLIVEFSQVIRSVVISRLESLFSWLPISRTNFAVPISEVKSFDQT